MLLVDDKGQPLSVFTVGANRAEVHTLETLVENTVTGQYPQRVVYDKAMDANWIRQHMADRGIDLICPHRKGRKSPPIQDGRKLRRYAHRWIVERTFAWLFNNRRLIVRHEYYAHLFEGFVQLACLLLVLNRF